MRQSVAHCQQSTNNVDNVGFDFYRRVTNRAAGRRTGTRNQEWAMTPQRTAVVTGAASERGIGRETARRLAEDGWAIVVLDLDAEAAAGAAGAIAAEYGVATFAHGVDVADELSVTAAQRAVSAQVTAGQLPVVGAVVNIAGITSPVPFLDTTLDLWNKVLAVNATGTYLVTKAFLPELLAAGWGRIITMSSVSAQRGGGVFGKVP
jgi:NAD(P)-dependent dehydrogenase (short-subunit alcohol dehydrogenase family)